MNKYARGKYKLHHSMFNLQALAYNSRSRFLSGTSISDIMSEHRIINADKSLFKRELALAIIQWPIANIGIAESTRLFEFLNKELNLDMGFIYCIEVFGRIKIGKTIDFHKRMSSYRSHNGQAPIIVELRTCHNHSTVEALIKSKTCKKTEWSEKENLDKTLQILRQEVAKNELSVFVEYEFELVV